VIKPWHVIQLRRPVALCGLLVEGLMVWTTEPSMRTPGGEVIGGRRGRSLSDGGLSESFSADGVAVLVCCTA
jgi:hypothetical protein